jgi:integrase
MNSDLASIEGSDSAGALQLPSGLTPEDAERVMNYAAQDLSEATRRVYALQWKQFTSWADKRGADALPADPATVAAYLSERAPDRSVSWITQAAAAIRKAHERAGADSPTLSAGVQRTMKGIRREHGAPPEPKAAARTVHIRRMVEAIETPPPAEDAGVSERAAYLRSLRDRALILLGYAAALRRSELAAVERAHVTFNPEGLELLIPRSKGDQDGEGAVVGVNYGKDLCPVTALRAWLDAAGIESGPVFRAVPRHAMVAPDERATPISGRTVRNVVAGAAEAAGLDADAFAGHSLRRGHLTQGALNGADLSRLQAQARHADPRTTSEYIEDANRMQTNTSRDLGL